MSTNGLRKIFFLACCCRNESPSGRCWCFWEIIISYRIIDRQTSGAWDFFYSCMCTEVEGLNSILLAIGGHWKFVGSKRTYMVQCVLATQLTVMRKWVYGRLSLQWGGYCRCPGKRGWDLAKTLGWISFMYSWDNGCSSKMWSWMGKMLPFMND